MYTKFSRSGMRSSHPSKNALNPVPYFPLNKTLSHERLTCLLKGQLKEGLVQFISQFFCLAFYLAWSCATLGVIPCLIVI